MILDNNDHFLGNQPASVAVTVLHTPGLAERTLRAFDEIVEKSSEEGLAHAVEILRICKPSEVEQMLLTLVMKALHSADDARAQKTA